MNEQKLFKGLPEFENTFDISIFLEVMFNYKLSIEQIKHLSIYQILLLNYFCFKKENKELSKQEQLLAWLNPALYAELHKEKKKDEFFVENL